MRKVKTKTEIDKASLRRKIIEQALILAAQEPWETVAPLEIAQACGVTYGELCAVFPHKADIVRAITTDLDRQTEEAGLVWDSDTPLRDRLFDVIMERFDLATPHRAAHISFLKAFGWVKNEICTDISQVRGSMKAMAALAGFDVGGRLGELRLAGLCAVYGWVMLTWMNDNTPDLSKTMAVLDQALGRAQKLANYAGI